MGLGLQILSVMLTQSIHKYKEPPIVVYQGNVFQHPAQRQMSDGRYSPNEPMGKYQYAEFLKTLPMKKGDWVAYKLCSTYSNWSCWKVMDIIEIHHMVKDWGTKYTGPKIMYLAGWEIPSLRNSQGQQNTRLQTVLDYKVVNPDQVPRELLEMYADTKHS
jgi:hypothetical protein